MVGSIRGYARPGRASRGCCRYHGRAGGGGSRGRSDTSLSGGRRIRRDYTQLLAAEDVSARLRETRHAELLGGVCGRVHRAGRLFLSEDGEQRREAYWAHRICRQEGLGERVSSISPVEAARRGPGEGSGLGTYQNVRGSRGRSRSVWGESSRNHRVGRCAAYPLCTAARDQGG